MAYITGPAILKIGANYYYFKDGLTEKIDSPEDRAQDDVLGTVARHNVSRKITLSGTPTAMRRNLDVLYPYSLADIGNSVMTLTPELYTKAGKKIAFARGGITKASSMLLSATGDLFSSPWEFTMLGKTTDEPTDVGHWLVITDAAFPNGLFDSSLVKRYRYTAAFGDAPFDAMTAQNGFTFDPGYSVSEIKDDNVGIADIILTDVLPSVKFTPSLLTEAQINTLIRLEGATALQPGDKHGSGTDLVITGGVEGDGFIFTLLNADFSEAARRYKTGELRGGEIMALNSPTFTAGVPDDLFTMEEWEAAP